MASWDIFRELDSLRREMDEAFRGVGFTRPLAATFPSPQATRRFPLINLNEDEGNVYLEALLPGVDPKQTELSVLSNSVSIAGERKPFAEQRGQIVHRSELGSGKFARTIEIPVGINPDNISAQYSDGILRITMPKAEHVKPKKIDISVS